jgi:hypothetical protein
MTDWFATIVRKPKDLQLKDYFRGNVALVEVDACTIEGEHKFLPSAVSLPWLQDCLFRAWMRVVCMMHVKSKWQVDHGRLRWARVGRDSCEFRYMLLGHLLFSSSKRISNKNVRTAFLLSYCCRWTHYDNWQDSLWSHARFSSSTTYRSPMISLSLFFFCRKKENVSPAFFRRNKRTQTFDPLQCMYLRRVRQNCWGPNYSLHGRNTKWS